MGNGSCSCQCLDEREISAYFGVDENARSGGVVDGETSRYKYIV